MNEHLVAVEKSIDIVDTVRSADLQRPTPCAGWDLTDLLTHMTAQHRGFAAAARGAGADPAHWQTDSVAEAIRSDPAGAYADAARDVLAAFSAGVDEAEFALPDFGDNAVFPGAVAMGFHFVDYVVHGWDVSASLGVEYELPDDVLTAVAPLVFSIPDGDIRLLDTVPFDSAVQPVDGAGTFDCILRHLGRNPGWAAGDG